MSNESAVLQPIIMFNVDCSAEESGESRENFITIKVQRVLGTRMKDLGNIAKYGSRFISCALDGQFKNKYSTRTLKTHHVAQAYIKLNI